MLIFLIILIIAQYSKQSKLKEICKKISKAITGYAFLFILNKKDLDKLFQN